MKKVFICTSKSEDVNGISVHFSMEVEPSKASPPPQGNLSYHFVDEQFASQHKAGKKYVLTLTEAKEEVAAAK